MESNLQTVMEFIQKHPGIMDGEKAEVLKLLKEGDKKLAIAEFKLDRTEKVKRTTAILLEETIEELELKRKAIEETNIALQKSLEELKAAQAQLVHAEKMASLGELTAGIAHEIQNPLNFVNNFSEVSKELIEEMNNELAAGNYDLAMEIASDIEQNLVKIHHHGKRADSIVKGMLQHSRTSSGQKELTDINVLAEEYLRLSYHGLKSRIKDFNTSLNTNLEPGLPKLSIVPQDMGRVVLNLVNNAFYAVHEKSKSGLSGYIPAVTLKTQLQGKQMELSIADNGNGIPESIRGKIFQPFFTTKPTGEGTGLGLSLSYDIVKTHGGEMLVESIEGKGTTFIIRLPIQ
jgi:two-component system, NtrC family, sensor kinase